jgi:integrase
MSRVFRRGENYWIDFRDGQGIRHRRKIGPSKRIAREVLDGILGNVARRQHLGVIEESAVSFADFADEWARRIFPTLRPRTAERWGGIVKQHLKPYFRGALRAVSREQIEAYIARRLEAGVTAVTVRIELTCLRHLLRRAVDWERLSTYRFSGVKLPKEKPGRTRYLSLEEIDRLLAACDGHPYLRAFVIVALNTGARRNEILSLTRRSIDWQNRTATLETTKNGEARRLPLNDAALEALRSLPPRIDGVLFPLKPHQVTTAFVRAVRRAGVENFRLHDCRHTFASYHAMAGIQGRGLQGLLGHRDPRMTLRYSHLSDQYLAAAVNAVQLGAAQPAQDATGKSPNTR